MASYRDVTGRTIPAELKATKDLLARRETEIQKLREDKKDGGKEVQEIDTEDKMTQEDTNGDEEEEMPDLADPDVANATMKIQAGYRGMRARKEVKDMKKDKTKDEEPSKSESGEDSSEEEESSSSEENSDHENDEGGANGGEGGRNGDVDSSGSGSESDDEDESEDDSSPGSSKGESTRQSAGKDCDLLLQHRDSGVSLSITPLTSDDVSLKNMAGAANAIEIPVVPLVKGIICVAPSPEGTEVNEETNHFNSTEKEISDEESSSGISEPSNLVCDDRRVSKKRPFAFVKSLATAMQLPIIRKRKVGTYSIATKP